MSIAAPFGALVPGLTLVCLIAAWPVPAAAAGAHSEAAGPAATAPLRVRNLSPATQLFGLPRPLGTLAAPDTTELALTVEHANNFTAASNDRAAVFFDGTTTVTSVSLRRGWGRRFEWGLEVPHVHHGGGFTDSFIDGFHDLFGFPGGGRDAVPSNRMDYRIDQTDGPVAAIDGATSHVGDVRGWLGWRVHQSPGRGGALRAQVKVPTGSVATLSGSEGVDVALWLEWHDARLLEALHVTVTLNGGLTLPGHSELADTQPQDAVLSGHVGVHYPLTSWLVLRAQLDGHSEVIDTGLDQFAAGALQGTLGGSLHLSPALTLDLGVTEDLTGAAAPDVVFLATVAVRL
ncbi:MAG: DUF3187 family protein [Gammaproteobacteria bacterium]|nr:DUF3187 family protein [Gammaproteobacteria bacterium]